MPTVGSSAGRTPGKHAMLDKTMGRESGVAFKGWGRPKTSHHYFVLDLTAGDGLPDINSGTSSPLIIQKHLAYADRYFGGNMDALLVEKRPYTYARLKANFPDMDILHCDARELHKVIEPLGMLDDCALIVNDPNSITEFALTDELLEMMPQYTTTYSTLGCNANGVKRMIPQSIELMEEQLQWYDHVKRILGSIPWNHDALFIRLNSDKHQWAYLVTGPTVWRPRYENDAHKAWAPHWEKGLSMAWYKTQRRDFTAMCDDLFLTNWQKRNQGGVA